MAGPLKKEVFLRLPLPNPTTYPYLDNDIVGESFLPDPNDPFIIDGDEIVNGQLVKDTLSGDFMVFFLIKK